jgi:hypothetical protein
MITNFGSGNKARDNILKGLNSRNSWKPKNTTVLVYINRLLNIVAISNLVKVFVDEISNQLRNKIIFNRMPKTWQKNWVHAGKEISTANSKDIQDYFEGQKEIMEEEANLNKSKINTNNNKDVRNNNNDKNKMTFQVTYHKILYCSKKQRNDTIIQHQWADCSFDTRSTNYNAEKYKKEEARYYYFKKINGGS